MELEVVATRSHPLLEYCLACAARCRAHRERHQERHPSAVCCLAACLDTGLVGSHVACPMVRTMALAASCLLVLNAMAN